MIRKAISADMPALIGVWETAVGQTHDFLAADDFRQIRGQMPDYLHAAELIVWEDGGAITGFAGICGDMLDMLFVCDRGRGIGKKLLEHAINEYGIRRLDVNEYNISALGFYQKAGFEVTGRSATDSGGRPYPLLHMSLKKRNNMVMDRKVRVRFAPSPTGPLHIGGVRTALYNYLFARRHGGTFILRIEDTDSNRFVPGAEDYIDQSLKWCGITVDEGVNEGGPYGPYRQSERRDIYLQYALGLVESGNAYYAFDTPEALDTLRKDAESRGENFAYNYAVRDSLETSLRLSPDQVRERRERGDQWVIRFKMPENENVVMHDLIRGEVTVNTSTLDDKVLYKSADQLPTYHLANIVDDHLMEISHVIRGEEWLPSLPLHYLLYRAFGWTETQPVFAHLPLLLKPSGQGKLSKRDGDKLGFPVFPLQWTDPKSGEISRGYREDGYFPEAFINMLALLGWNPGTEQEIFSMEELTHAFSLDRVGKSGARFSPEKAHWFNAQYMHMRNDEELGRMFLPILAEHGVETDLATASRVASFIKTRATFISDFWELSHFIFIAPAEYEQKTVDKYWKGDNPAYLRQLRDLLASFDDFSASATRERVLGWITENGMPMGQVMNTFRVAVIGVGKGPDMFDICEVIGRDETLRRIDRALETLPA